MRTPITANEENRLHTLRRYNILDTAAEKCFDELTQLASVICETPISLISLVDENRLWFKSRVGFDVTETSRDVAFCAHAILENDILVVDDALTDARFSANPLVTSDPHIRFYAGAPLTVIGGESLGTLCVMDNKPRDLSGRQREALQVLCGAVVTQLELRRALNDINFMSRCLPMCVWCRSIRMDDGTWRSAGTYIVDTDEVSQGICPSCREQTMKSASIAEPILTG